MKKLILFSTTYPYTAGIIAMLWLGTVILLKIDPNTPANQVLFINVLLTLFIAEIGFRK